MCTDGKQHDLVPYPPVVHPDGSMSPRMQCGKCGAVFE
jgi:hypothetical protein